MRYHQWKLVGFDNFSIKSGSRGVTFVWDKGALCVYFGVSVVSIWGNWPCIKSQNVPIPYSWRKITGCWNYGVLEKKYRGITSCDCNSAVDEINYADVMLVLPFRVVSSELWSYLRMAPPRLFRVYDSRERYIDQAVKARTGPKGDVPTNRLIPFLINYCSSGGAGRDCGRAYRPLIGSHCSVMSASPSGGKIDDNGDRWVVILEISGVASALPGSTSRY